MAKRNKPTNGAGNTGGAGNIVKESKKGTEISEPRSLGILAERPKTSRDLATLMYDAVYDNISGAISVGQGNLILNMAGKVIQIKKLELQLGSMKKHIEHQAFNLPGN